MLRDYHGNIVSSRGDQRHEIRRVDIVVYVDDVGIGNFSPQLQATASRRNWVRKADIALYAVPREHRAEIKIRSRGGRCVAIVCKPRNSEVPVSSQSASDLIRNQFNTAAVGRKVMTDDDKFARGLIRQVKDESAMQ
jgi:hypothetical protein